MSAAIQEALNYYREGNHVMVVRRLGPVVEGKKNVEPALALLMGQSSMKLEQYAQAARWYDRACVPGLPNLRQVRVLAANVYIRVHNWQRACEITKTLLDENPEDFEALHIHRNCLRMLLKFDEMEQSDARVTAWMETGMPGIFDMEKPLEHVFWSDREDFAARLTKIDGGTPFKMASRLKRHARPHIFGPRIRVAYLSNDLSDKHATMRLIQGVFLAHDHSAFDIHILCHTPDGLRGVDGGMRSLLPNLHEIDERNDENVAALIRSLSVDILVDLKGHTKDARPDIINHGPAPIQVAWLGFPGINVGIDCDYVIGDHVVTPPESQQYWDARFCRLPETYQPNDDTYRALPPASDRASVGLPEDKMVFASFNSQVKISTTTFRMWMKVLRGAPESLLWMMVEGDDARRNFRAAVAAAGVDPGRILFASVVDYPAHVARLQAADLGLDTFPCTGHTTTSDKLWAGLPLVTMKGGSFASRVSESLLRAHGFPELVAEDEESCVDLNIRLATDHGLRADLRRRLAERRFVSPLFDTERFTRHLEDAYRLMVAQAKSGLPPAPLDVPARPPRTSPFKI